MTQSDPDQKESKFQTDFQSDNSTAESQSGFQDDSVSISGHDALEKTWAKIASTVSAESPYLGAHMSKAVLSKLTDNSMEIEVNGGKFSTDAILRKKNMILLQKVCNNFFGGKMTISVKAQKEIKKIEQKQHDRNILRKEALSHPLVEEALRVFNGKIADIRIMREAV